MNPQHADYDDVTEIILCLRRAVVYRLPRNTYFECVRLAYEHIRNSDHPLAKSYIENHWLPVVAERTAQVDEEISRTIAEMSDPVLDRHLEYIKERVRANVLLID